MIELGKRQDLIIKRFQSQGAYLGTEDGNDRDVLLPKDQIPEGAVEGTKVNVMVYNDSGERIIATTRKAKGEVGDIVSLKVASNVKFGAFLDWGLEKDVFLPFSESVGPVSEGREYLVALYIDKSGRICASMNLQNYLSTDSPYHKGQIVKGTIYSLNNDIGAFVAVENKYNGLIPSEELLGAYQIGDEIEARISNIKTDGKLDLSLRGPAHLEMAEDVNLILDKLKANNGFIPYNDKSNPQDIRDEFGISKAAFKRAIGKLYKERMIEFKGNGVTLI